MAYASALYTSASGTEFALTNSDGDAIEYLKQNDIAVYVNDVLQTVTTDYTFNSAGTAIVLNSAVSGAEVYIIRTTDISEPVVNFTAGSTLTSTDLNNSNEQYRFALQEFRDTYAALTEGTEDLGEFPGIIDSTETWISDDSHWPTTATLDNRFVDQLNDETIAGVKTFSSSPVVPTPSGGTDATNKDYVDDNYWNVDGETINLAEQNAGSPAWDDNHVATAAAASRRFDTFVQTTTPSDTNYEVGKTWLQNDADKTLSIWNGSAWVAVASGGAFTELNKVVYVDAVNGDDSLAGHRISNPKRTIKAAIDQINAETDANGNGSLVVVAPGIYAEEFPISIEKNDVSIVGTSLRNCVIHPAIGVTAATAAVNGSEYRIRFVGTTDFTAIGADDNNVGTVFTATGAGTGTGTLEDTAVQTAYDVDVPEDNELSTMFQVNSGTYIQNLTLQGMKAAGTRGGNTLDTDATYGLPTNQGWNFAFFPGATIRKSPYIQNCTNFSDSQINNADFTPHVPGEGAAGDLDSGGFSGGGILIDGSVVAAASPLRSMVCDSYTHTALNGPGIFVTNNGYTQVTSSYAFFAHYHLKCLNGGQANLAASTSDFGRYSLIADGQSATNIFTSNVDGAANDQATTFNINEPVADASWHGNANRPQPNMLVTVNGVTYPILSATARTDTEGGDGWTIEISRPDPANRSNNLGLNGAIADDDVVQFFLRSQIASSGHTMEYVGSGTDYRALPENSTGTFPVGADDPVTADATAGNAPCGVPSEDRQTIVLNNGAIWTAVTDHNGKFRVGGDQNTDPTFEVNQRSGFVNVPAAATNAVTKTGVTGAALIPVGTQAQRPTGATGHLRFNTDTSEFEGFDGTAWGTLGGAVDAADVTFTAGGDLAATDVQAAIDELDDEKVPRTATTGAALLPSGTELERPTGAAGHIRFNTDTDSFEGYNGTDWGNIGGGASAGGAIYENSNSITEDYTLTANTNGMSVSPLTISSGVTVTIPSGAAWVIL